MDVEFQEVCYPVTPGFSPWRKEETRTLLSGVSGCFRSGELSAVLGASGSGKTTLLNAVSSIRSRGVSGKFLLNGSPRDEEEFKKMSSYVRQEDTLVPHLSVLELMMFAAKLRLPSSFTEKQRRHVVEEILTEQGLGDVTDSRSEVLSGGERKRLSIALELVNNPAVLFLDEPTSGLDSVAAHNLVALLRRMAHNPAKRRTIVCTVHQPSASLFSSFDLVYFLGGGRCVYQGPPGRPLLSHLSTLRLDCPLTYSPQDYVIELVENEENLKVLCTVIKNGKERIASDDTPDIDLPEPTKSKVAQHRELSDLHAPQNSFWVQFSTLFYRMMLRQLRNKAALKLQILHHVGCGISMAIMFHHQVLDGNEFYSHVKFAMGMILFNTYTQVMVPVLTPLRLQVLHHVGCAMSVAIMFPHQAADGNEFYSHIKFAMGMVLFNTYTQVMVPVLTLPYEVKLLQKEHSNQWYRLLPYYMAYTLSRVPLMVLLILSYLTIIFFNCGLPWEPLRYVVFCSVAILAALVAEGMGLTIGALFSITNGSIVGPLSLSPFLAFAIYGFEFADKMNPLMSVLGRCSYMRAGTVALLLAMFGMDRGPLDCDETYCHFSRPEVLLRGLGLQDARVQDYVIDLLLMMLFFRITFYLALKWRLRR